MGAAGSERTRNVRNKTSLIPPLPRKSREGGRKIKKKEIKEININPISMGIRQGVAMDAIKFYLGMLCPTFLSPMGRLL
jgi:hypothetical protein